MRATVIYIGGYGRSGSTLLAKILDGHESVFACGELINLPHMISGTDSICSCGRVITECNFWSKILLAHGESAVDLVAVAAAQRRIEGFPQGAMRLLRLGRNRAEVELYGRFWRATLERMLDNLPPGVRFIVDSSKTTWSRLFRPMALRRLAGVDVKLVHIVRDGRGCIWSNLRGEDNGLLRDSNLRRPRPFGALRTSLHWPVANLGAYAFRLRFGSASYLRLKYEDLVANPAEAYARLGSFLGLRLDYVAGSRNAELVSPGHVLAGNRMRSSPRIRIAGDFEWRERLGLVERLLFWLVNWPLAVWYGYRF